VKAQCRKFLGALGDDWPLAAGGTPEFDLHAGKCSRCRIIRDTVAKTIELYRSCWYEKVPAELELRLMTALNARSEECRKPSTGY